MQLDQVVNATSLSSLFSVRNEIVEHFTSLRPAERREGFDVWAGSVHLRQTVASIIERRRHLLARPGRLKELVDLSVGIARERSAENAVPFPYSVLTGIYRTLENRLHSHVRQDAFIKQLRFDLERRGLVF